MQQSGRATTSTLSIGTVIQSNPLKIKTGELELNQEDLLLSTTVTDLKQGDILLLYPTPNKQSYIAICKVVKP